VKKIIKIYILILSLWTCSIGYSIEGLETQTRYQSLYKAYRLNSKLDQQISNPTNKEEILATLKEVKNDWNKIKDTSLGKNILSKASKLRKMKIILDGFNKCLGDGKNEKILASSILKSIETIPADKFLEKSNCLEGVLAELVVIDDEKILNSYAPLDHVYKRQNEKDYQDLVETRWEKIIGGENQEEVDALTEKIEAIDDKSFEAGEKKKSAKVALRDKLYKKIRKQMVHMHGMFNYLLEDKDPRKEHEKIEETLQKACPGCEESEIKEHRESLRESINALKSHKVKPINTERFRNRVQNNMIDLAKTAYKIEERRIYDENGDRVERKSPNEDLSENRINYKFNPGSNIVTEREQATEARRRFIAKKRELQTTEYGQLAQLGIVPNLDHVGLGSVEEKDANGKTVFRMTFRSCPTGQECTNLFEKEPENPFQLGRKLGETFGMKDFDLTKFKKERLGSIEDAMANFKKLYDKGSLDELLDKLIMNNPVTAGELLAESPKEYLQLYCERIKLIGKDKDFDDTLKSTYLNITAALIIGGFVFMGPIGAAPLAGKVLMGSWYALTGVSAYFGVKAYQNEDFAKASCYSGTGDKTNCAQIDEYYTDKKYAILFGVMVPGSDLLRIADAATRAAGVGFSVKRTFDTAITVRGRVLTFKSQGENIVDEAVQYQAESGIKEVLNLSDEELNQLPESERKEIVGIIQEVFEKGGERGVMDLVLAIRTIKDLEEEGQKVEKELSGKALLDMARRLQHQYDSK